MNLLKTAVVQILFATVYPGLSFVMAEAESLPSSESATPDSVEVVEIIEPEVSESNVTIEQMSSTDSDQEPVSLISIQELLRTPKWFYRAKESSTTVLPNSAGEFGWLSFETAPLIELDDDFGVAGGINFHFLSGPQTTPIPPRVFDFMLGLQTRKRLNAHFSYDVLASVGVFSDFEGSAREGVRYPGHAVGFLNGDCCDLVFGVEYLGQDDIKLLPVCGLVLRNRDVRAELIFPRPRIDFALSSCHSLFVKGGLGGGSWDFERPNESEDVFTYRDYQVTVGLMTIDKDKDVSSIEMGVAFGRKLSFRDSQLKMDFDDSFVIRFVRVY